MPSWSVCAEFFFRFFVLFAAGACLAVAVASLALRRAHAPAPRVLARLAFGATAVAAVALVADMFLGR